MKNLEIIKTMARDSGVSPAEAADRLDQVVREILSNVRKGKALTLPGLGRFSHGADGRVAFEREGKVSHE